MIGRLRSLPDYKCRKCTYQFRPQDRLPAESVVSNEFLKVVNKFCYLGDMISAAGSIHKSIAARIRCGWKKFRELLPLLTSRCFHSAKKVTFFRHLSAVLFPMVVKQVVKAEDLAKLERNDNGMVGV